MTKYNLIIKNKMYIKAINAIVKQEKNRIYCRHGIEHCLDVARIAYILSLEHNLELDRDEIYAAALLHDIGRAGGGENHDKLGARLAEPILMECGYGGDALARILSAIEGHRAYTQGTESLADVIAAADKLSRQCWSCEARESCNWNEEKRNNCIKY